MPNNRSSIYAPIQEKLALAHQLYSTWGSVLLKDTYIYGLLEKIKQEVNRAKKTMRMFGIVDICRHCDEEHSISFTGLTMFSPGIRDWKSLSRMWLHRELLPSM
ncbi:MAG: hypothetical protein V2A69_11745 [Pseudomonadota bacterium]